MNLRLGPRPFLLAGGCCLLVGAALSTVSIDPLEAAMWAAIGGVLGGLFVGLAIGLTAPDVPAVDYTAIGSVLVGLAFLGLALLVGRPAGGYLVAIVGGGGAALVGLDSGIERADGSGTAKRGGNDPSDGGA